MASPRHLTWKIDKTPDGYHATIAWAVPGQSAPAFVGAMGGSSRQAIARAATLMQELASSPIARAIMPPGTAAAIEAVKAIATAKDVRATLRRFGGKGARRLARAIGF